MRHTVKALEQMMNHDSEDETTPDTKETTSPSSDDDILPHERFEHLVNFDHESPVRTQRHADAAIAKVT